MRESIQVKLPSALTAAARLDAQRATYRAGATRREPNVPVKPYVSRRTAVVPRRVAY